MSLLKKEYNKTNTLLEQLVNVAIPLKDDYIKSMILSDQKEKYDRRNMSSPKDLDTTSAFIYVGAVAVKYVSEITLLFTAAETLLR